MSTTTSGAEHAPAVDLEKLVADNDLGGRAPRGLTAGIIAVAAIAWSLFHLWYASPLPFALGVFVLNDTEARAIHLAFALFLAFLAYPAFRSSPREHIPLADWCLAALAAFAGAYLFLFYQELAHRPGQPTALDLATAALGLLVLLEATRRCLGLAMVIVASLFLFYIFAGPYMPEAIQHKGASLTKMLNHQWLTTEGVFGIALGVSTGFVFLFVLFGTLLEKAGGGNWMMQLSIAMLGHLRGGPAKVAVVSSGLNGVVSGSSVSNVVSGGIFTIPLMKRTGLSGVKAGAIEASASINGQIMPPVMGAAAFLMVEYVGVPYSEIVRHAFLPALISYISLFYIVHIEAVKIDAPLIPREQRSVKERLVANGIGWSGTILAFCALYYAVLAIQSLFGSAAGFALAAGGAGLYVASVWFASRYDDLAIDEPDAPVIRIPRTWEVVRSGIDFMIPIVVLLWCLMVENMSPGLSAFWATLVVLAIVATRKPLLALFRGSDMGSALRTARDDLIGGLEMGGRNMIGIAVATATAGIVVGTVTLTGLGLMMTDFVELISGGNVILMLVFVAITSLVLGMGIPTTANYILVATLMAPVIVELGAQAGLAIPLIAVHLFVFYFGIMADITPPVGLASFAAAAISREDPMATGFQGALYSLRTAVLPFVFIFNPQLLLIDVGDYWTMAWVILTATVAILVFAAATMGWYLTRNRWWETAILLVICFSLFRPDWWLDRFYPRHLETSPRELTTLVRDAPDDARLTLVVSGLSIEGDTVTKTVSLPLGKQQDARARLQAAGLGNLVPMGDKLMMTSVGFGSHAKRAGLEAGFEVVSVLTPAPRPNNAWVGVLALTALAGLTVVQRRRREREGSLRAVAAGA